MKYYKTSKFPKAITSTGVVTMIAFLLVAVGAIAWFVFSKNENEITKPLPESNVSQNEYLNGESSYNDSSVSEITVDEVDKSVSDVPYQSTPSEAIETQEKQSFMLPVKGNVCKGYSDSALQYSATYGDMRLHTGVDISCAEGTNVKSAGSGIVKSITDDASFGKTITVEHLGEIIIKYCGMQSVLVKENDKVAVGDILGESGVVPCECADKPHIHIEVLVNGEITSPLEALGLEN